MNNPSIWPWLTLIAIGLNGCAHQSAQVDMQPLDVRAELVADRPDPLTGRIEELEPVLSPLALTEELLSLTTPPKSEQRI
ncbi:MAG: hypothetical protein ACI9RY_001498, partial [Reinekea sp.]